METKLVYREYFPGYMGHIPLKNDVIGMTVGATNDHIKKTLTKEPPHEDQLVPAPEDDYNYYNKNYFNDNFSKEYKLEEEKVFSNQSHNAKTWISGSKYNIYPQHIPGYKAHIPGIKSSNIFGLSYSKATSVAIKGDYVKGRDVPAEERYNSITNQFYKIPTVRSNLDGTMNIESKKIIEKMKENSESNGFLKNTENKDSKINESSDAWNKTGKTDRTELCQSFKDILHLEKKPISELPYIVGYKGFRRDVKSGNYYGKNFREISLNASNQVKFKK